MFPKNAWYVACTPDEIDDKPLGRMVCGEKMALFRGQEGQASALEDFCPHRGAALSLGHVCEGKLVCGYHGLVMGCNGKTDSMPGQRVAGFPAIKAYPVIERYGFVWVWPGDAALADASKLHHLHWAESPEWAYGGGMYHVACDYRLMIDNLMDLTHETYVHTTSIGQKEIDETPVSTKTVGQEVVTSRFMNGVMAPPFWRANMHSNGLPIDHAVDRWQICHFTPPSHVLIEVGVALAGHGGYDAPADKKVSAIVVDFITPETETSMWYFWGMARNFNVKDRNLTAQIKEGQGKVFSEDTAVLEAQQRNLTLHKNRKLLMLNIDAGGVQSRRIIERLIAAEQPQAEPLAA
jgi:vanillate O-demethylase monooxygenase subunit